MLPGRASTQQKPVEKQQASEENEDFFVADLFLNTEYQLQNFEYSGRSIELLVSPSACTDFDLTGQILWPAATLMTSYLAANPHWAVGRRGAAELGAGLGLVGCLAAQLCPVVLTDHNDNVLSVCRRNADLNRGAHNMVCLRLDWTSADDIAVVRAASPDADGYDLLLGADVCYGQSALPALFSCAAQLLTRTPSAAFLLGYVSRAKIIDRSLPVAAQDAGLTLQEIPGTRGPVGSGLLEGMVFQVAWPAHCFDESLQHDNEQVQR